MELTKQHNIRHKYLMLETAYYRRDYTGEVIAKDDRHFLIKPKDIFYRQNNAGKAIVVGNGITRNNKTFEMLLKSNSNRPLLGYKIVYACNGAAWDLPADYYVISNRLLMAHLHDTEQWQKFFMPCDLFMDYDTTNMIPVVSNMDAGSMAVFLACFDGNDEIFLFGFDGNSDNVYEGKPGYERSADVSTWEINLALIMRAFPDHRFYRVGSGKTPVLWQKMPNFIETNYKEAIYLGDF